MPLTSNTEWHSAAKPPNLEPGEIHVWRFQLDRVEADLIRFKNCLSAEEHDRAASFRFIQDQKRFVIRRAILRHLLGSYLDLPARNVRLLSETNKKPVVEDQNGSSGVRFSCSQSADWGLITVARDRELGVDIECHGALTDVNHMAEICLSQNEIIEFLELTEDVKIKYFIDVWTCKEAFVKAIGKGLSFPLKEITVPMKSNQPVKLLKVENHALAGERWKLISLDVKPGFSAALAYENWDAKLKFFEWVFMS